MEAISDPVNHPSHYADNKIADLECIEVTRHFLFPSGNAIKYCWRAGFKINDLEDLDKAEFYVNDAAAQNAVEGETAKRMADHLQYYSKFEAKYPEGSRESVVICLIDSLAYGDYNDARDAIDTLRGLVKENQT